MKNRVIPNCIAPLVWAKSMPRRGRGFISEASMAKTRTMVMVYETFLVRQLFLTLSPSRFARKRRPKS